MEPTVVEPVDPFQRGKLQIVEVTRKIALCESNPGDLHCEGFDVDALFNPDEIDFGSSTPWAGHGGDGGDGDKRPGLDFTEGDPKQRDEELKKLCDANPSDSLCAGITGGDSSSTKDDGGQTGTPVLRMIAARKTTAMVRPELRPMAAATPAARQMTVAATPVPRTAASKNSCPGSLRLTRCTRIVAAGPKIRSAHLQHAVVKHHIHRRRQV